MLLAFHVEDVVLARLAHARDGVFLRREGITERGCLTMARSARCLGNRTHTGNARETRKHSFDFGVLEGSSEGVAVVLHALHYTYLSGFGAANFRKHKRMLYDATGEFDV